MPDAPVAEPALFFGPARCLGCSARFPVHDGLIDLAGERPAPSLVQQAMEQPWLARAWDRSLRPAVDSLLTRGRLDQDSEYTVLRSFLGAPQGPLLDLGCGSGTVLRRLARDYQGGPVVGVDLSRPMLEEAMAQVREDARAADFVRAAVPPLPLNDASVGAVVAVGFLQFLDDPEPLLKEIARVLKPRGTVVATAWESAPVPRSALRRLGLFTHAEGQLRDAAKRADLVQFERLKIAPFLLWKAERP